MGQAGDDTFTVDGLSTVGLIDGGDNDDTLTVNNSGESITLGADVTAVETINATNGTLIAQDIANTWTVSGANSGTLANMTKGSIDFTGMANLTGGDDVDNFTFTVTEASAGVDASTGSISGLIDGGTSADSTVVTDTLDITALTDAQTVELGAVASGTAGVTLNVDHIETIDASVIANVNNTLIGDDTTNTWTLTDTGIGSIRDGVTVGVDTTNTTFSGFSRLLGGIAADGFTVSGGEFALVDLGAGNDSFASTGGLVTSVLGQAGDDTFTVDGLSTVGLIDGGDNDDTLTVNNSGESITLGADVTAVETINATNGTLIAQDIANTWTVSGANSGTLANMTKGSIDFTGMANLTGGTDVDTFTFTNTVSDASTGSISGLIDGGTAADSTVVTDTLDITALTDAQTVELGAVASGTAGVTLNVDHIETIDASVIANVNNTLIGDDTTNTWTLTDTGIGSIRDGVTGVLIQPIRLSLDFRVYWVVLGQMDLLFLAVNLLWLIWARVMTLSLQPVGWLLRYWVRLVMTHSPLMAYRPLV